MGDFAPSVEAAQAALGAKIPIETRPHPSGAKGAQVSLDEVAARIRKGRLDPRIRAWAIRAIKADGEPRQPKNQAQTLLTALRKATTYVADSVNSEFMQAAHETLCLDEHGLCFRGGDCDDLCIAYGSAAMSIGIPVKVVGQSFDSSGIPTHVIIAIQDSKSKEWYRVDPSSKFDVGSYYPATKEQWIDPMEIAVPGQSLSGGDYVGVGYHPGLLGKLPSSDPNAILYNVSFLPQETGSLGEIPANPAPEERQAIYDAVVSQTQSALYTLETSVNDLRAAYNSVEQARRQLRPGNPYDPEPAGGIASLAAAPIGGVWTKSMSDMTLGLLQLGDKLVSVGHEALTGTRKILIDRTTGEPYIEAKDSDPWRLRTAMQSATDSVLAYYNKAGDILGGFTSRAGRILSADQIKQMIKGGTVQGVGVGIEPITVALVFLIVVGLVIAIAKVTDYFTVAKQCDTAIVLAREANTKTLLDMVAKGILTPEQAKSIQQTIDQGRVAVADADARNKAADPFTKFGENLGKVVTWLAIGGATIAGIYVAAPFIKTAAEDFRRKREEKRLTAPSPGLTPAAAEWGYR